MYGHSFEEAVRRYLYGWVKRASGVQGMVSIATRDTKSLREAKVRERYVVPVYAALTTPALRSMELRSICIKI